MHLGSFKLFFLFISSLLPSQFDAEMYNITPSHPIAEGQTLVSPSQIFELGFFTPNGSANKYVGLWHKSIFPRKYVWVANRDIPLAATDTLSTLRIGNTGELELVDGKQSSVWSANISNCSYAVLLDNGNFVVKDVTGANLWESFNFPSDSQLPNLLVGYDRRSGKETLLTSWKSENDPRPGIYSSGLSTDFPAQTVIWINGSTPHWRSGPWDNSKFIGIPSLNSLYLNTLVDNVTQGTRYATFSFDKSHGDRILAYGDISSEGKLRWLVSASGNNWTLEYESWNSPCDDYGACGPFGVCTASESPICKCLKGFIPKSKEEWYKGNWTGGCVRRLNLSCHTHTNETVSSKGNEGFLKSERMKVPDFHESLNFFAIAKSEDCEIQCLSNCSCLAYAYVDGIGCLVWYKDLIDMQQFPSYGEDVYIRLADLELGERKQIKLIVSLTVIGSVSILVSAVFSLYRWHANEKCKKI